MGLIGWIIIGGLAGWLASIVMGTDRQQGCLANIVIGVVGAVLGGAIVAFLGGQGVTGFNVWSLAVATFGAIVLLGLVRAVR